MDSEEKTTTFHKFFREYLIPRKRPYLFSHLKKLHIIILPCIKLLCHFYLKERGRGTSKNRTLNEDNRYKWNKATLTKILTRQEYGGDVVDFKTTRHFRDKRSHYVDRSQWHITENVYEMKIA